MDKLISEAIKDAIGNGRAELDFMVKKLVAEAKRRPKLYRAITDEHVPGIARELILAHWRQERGSVLAKLWPPAKPDRNIADGALSCLGKGFYAIYRLPGPVGVLFAEATRPQVRASAEFLESQSHTMLRQAAGLRLIEKRLKNDVVKVSEVISEAAAVKLFQETEAGA